MNSLGLSALLFLGQALALNNGVGKLPTMGYDTYNAFEKNYDGALALEQARLMKEYGLVDAGYNTFILDDFYALENRSEKGEMIPDPVKFPHGMLKWTKSLNKYGLSASAYSSNGYKTCGGLPGAYGRELQDLETWRSWGWGGKGAIVKYDNCYIPYDNVTMENEYGRYERMLEAIETLAKKYKHPNKFIYSLCQWGWQDPHNWAPRISNAWRIDGDIRPYWSAIANILLLASTSYGATDHYQHGDMDMLEVGNSGRGTPVGDLTVAEQRTHFTAWALLKSHLLIGTDLRNATKDAIEILGNKELIAINQDPHEGKAIAPFRIGLQPDYSRITYNKTSPPGFWAGASSYGPVFMIINTLNETQEIFFDLTENWAVRAGRQYKVRDMWLHEDVGVAVRNWTVKLGAHDVAALLLKDAGPEPKETGPLPCATASGRSFRSGSRDASCRFWADLSPHLNLIEADDIEDDADIAVQMSFNLMAGLANNRRKQCGYVKKLSVRNGYVKENTRGTRFGPASKGYFDVTSLRSHSPWVWANMILGIAIPQMSLLSEVIPGVRAMRKPALSSLALWDIDSRERGEDVSCFLLDNKDSLKVLKLRFMEEYSIKDKLLNIVNPIIELESQFELHILHLRNALSPGLPGWQKAFDFHSIRVFILIETSRFGKNMSKVLWKIFQHTDQQFETLITNCEDDAFVEFVESTHGLEHLILSRFQRPFDNFPKLDNHFGTLRSLFLPQDAPWDFGKSLEETGAPLLGPTAFIKAFFGFCDNNSAASAFLSRIELVSCFRTLWSIDDIGQIDEERESYQLDETDGPAEHANYSEPLETKLTDRQNFVPVQIGWTDHLDDEMILAVHTWVLKSSWKKHWSCFCVFGERSFEDLDASWVLVPNFFEGTEVVMDWHDWHGQLNSSASTCQGFEDALKLYKCCTDSLDSNEIVFDTFAPYAVFTVFTVGPMAPVHHIYSQDLMTDLIPVTALTIQLWQIPTNGDSPATKLALRNIKIRDAEAAQGDEFVLIWKAKRRFGEYHPPDRIPGAEVTEKYSYPAGPQGCTKVLSSCGFQDTWLVSFPVQHEG
ncbi:hypothetical protein V493_00845 [Pseudogymnoascus sp. VKM F-4281 (FW-2241)]|nr:hypothetical protein V493_00845 [Pseudogymnoascus sp. VKM F-4281 (FW-2241)]